ncbi:G patch domain-containing protein 4 [Drosophila sechellia]|uniref:G patch domain-containing protein 4 n=1 Tax=Drosophila sechellia TaxID=7238 RepID=B4I002_DROSE|nr:G patch domain-containing protein 4 [Drosophila sechellia]EDW53609.1 GM12098 [Drosophila sechellia]
MDFAKKILGKYGWKEGDGLGKNNTGIAVPLKAALKFDNAGLGVDRAQEFNDHWWERCFNEAASNVDVQVKQDGQVSTSRRKGEEAVEISTSGFSARKLKKAKEQHASAGKTTYENFLQTSLLTQSGGEVETSERIRVEDIEVTKVAVLTDAELFKACGGRTAHKGARHGLKLGGKIARLEQQEREMLEKLQRKLKTAPETEQTEHQAVESVDDSVEQCDTKPKKKKKSRTEEVSEAGEVSQLEEPIKTKKKKKDKAEKAEEESPAHQTQEDPVKIKKKKSKTREPEEEVQDVAEEPVKTKKKKDKKAESPAGPGATEGSPQDAETDEQVKSKKKRKTVDSSEESETSTKLKKKRKNKENV